MTSANTVTMVARQPPDLLVGLGMPGRGPEGDWVTPLAFDRVDSTHAVLQSGFFAVALKGAAAFRASVATKAKAMTPTVFPGGEVRASCKGGGRSRFRGCRRGRAIRGTGLGCKGRKGVLEGWFCIGKLGLEGSECVLEGLV
jgi:hypothetical protein